MQKIKPISSIFSTENPIFQVALDSLILLIVTFAAYAICRVILRYVIPRVFCNKNSFSGATLGNRTVWKRLFMLVPLLIIQIGTTYVPSLQEPLTIIRNIAAALTLLYAVLAICAFLDAVIEFYTQKGNTRIRSIKSYLQLAKIIIYVLGTIGIIAALIDRSPILLLSGLGAMSAITMLVFKDTILSFVAGVQLSFNNMLKIGDWIEMPQVNADGDVIDISLQVVKVQNWDKTITTIPTWRLTQESFRNWSGMRDSGGRRIKRSIKIDVASVGFLTKDQFEQLSNIYVLKDYLAGKQVELQKYNASLGEAAQMNANRRRLTNLGTFRAYALAYLKAHPDVNQNMTCMVRLLEPTNEGTPMEIYCFTNTVAWTEYEGIQGDIFDHLISILPEFGLRPYQQPSGHDLSLLIQAYSNSTKTLENKE